MYTRMIGDAWRAYARDEMYHQRFAWWHLLRNNCQTSKVHVLLTNYVLQQSRSTSHVSFTNL